jgi:hypothetical protein
METTIKFPRKFKSLVQVKQVNKLVSKFEEDYLRVEVMHISTLFEGQYHLIDDIEFDIKSNVNILRVNPSSIMIDRLKVSNILVVEFEECIDNVTSYLEENEYVLHTKDFFFAKNISQALPLEVEIFMETLYSEQRISSVMRSLETIIKYSIIK